MNFILKIISGALSYQPYPTSHRKYDCANAAPSDYPPHPPRNVWLRNFYLDWDLYPLIYYFIDFANRNRCM